MDEQVERDSQDRARERATPDNPEERPATGADEAQPSADEPDTDAEAEAEPAAVTREFVEAVRRAAGFRVSPRQVDAALIALGVDASPTPEEVAAVVAASRGDVSQRQRRHGDYWRVLGARLTVQGEDGSPAGQRTFIGAARAAARRSVSDLLLLQVAVGIAELDRRLHAEVVGRVSRWLIRHHGLDLASEQINALLPQALRAVTAEQRAKRRASAAQARGQAAGQVSDSWVPSTGRRPRGSSLGGKRRRRPAPLPARKPKPRRD